MSGDPACPSCGQRDSKVLKVKAGMAGSALRRRECVCGRRFTCYEQVNTMPRFRLLIVSLGFGRDLSS